MIYLLCHATYFILCMQGKEERISKKCYFEKRSRFTKIPEEFTLDWLKLKTYPRP